MSEIAQEDVDRLREKLGREAEASGYHINPDSEFTNDLVRGLLVNEARYGYMACPCRLASGDGADDLDIVCPCDYRDADLAEHDACYCALYVSGAVLKGAKKPGAIPERRPSDDERQSAKETVPSSAGVVVKEGGTSSLPLPVWRCRVCGYLCARDGPPETCPICKAGKDRFERFIHAC